MDSSPSLLVNQADSQQLISIELDEPQRIFFPGSVIKGTLKLDKTHYNYSHSKVEIHLGCSFQMRDKSLKQPQFKVLNAPRAPGPDNDCVPFELQVPPNVPSYVDDASVPAQILYKVKAIHMIPDMAVSLWPKASVPVRVRDQISIKDKSLQATLTSEKEVALVIPRDIYLKQSHVRKGDIHTVSAKLSINCSGFLAGQPIPFSLRVQHAAPVKHIVGAVVQLERVAHVISQDNATLIEATSLAETSVPVICDPDHFVAATTSKLVIPENVMPTCRLSPLQIFYRMRATVNMDMTTLVEEGLIRKRDKAYSMMKVMSGWQDSTCTGHTSSTIVLELPITIGTLDAEPPVYVDHEVADRMTTLAIKSDAKGSDETLPESPLLLTPPAYDASPNTIPVPLDMFAGVSRQPSAPDLQDLEKPTNNGRPVSWSSMPQSAIPPPTPPRRHRSVYSD